MTQTTPENGVEPATSTEPRTDSTDAPAVLLRNEDDAEHALDVRIADSETVLAEGCHTVAGDSQCAVAAGGGDGDLLRVDLRADHGATASLTVDSRRPRVPEFVVRRETIVVAGLN